MVADLSVAADRFAPGACARLVVKIGSALLVDPAGEIRRDWLGGIAADVAERRGAGQQVAIVSSGAIALGARRLRLARGGARDARGCAGGGGGRPD